MRLDNMRGSSNVEDRRGQSSSGGRSLGGMPLKLGGGLGGIIVVIIVIMLGGNPAQLLSGLGAGAGGGGGGGGGGTTTTIPGGVTLPGQTSSIPPGQEGDVKLVGKVLGSTEDVWRSIFSAAGETYTPATLVMFSGSVDSACGSASSASGPFYCPADQKIYIDLDFFRDLRERFGASGDFAQAYVIAHEVGHHVQNLLGANAKVSAARGQVSEREYNDLSVRLELQADFYAGVWAYHANKQASILEAGDIDEALRCAAAIGDDRLQMQARGHTVPDSFTHGTSEQRARWFRKGIETGDISKGDTFAASRL